MIGDVETVVEPVVVLAGAAIRYCRTAINAMVRTARSDGIRPTPLLVELADVLERAAADVRTSAVGSASLRRGVDASLSRRDEVTAEEAAEMLHTTTRNITEALGHHDIRLREGMRRASWFLGSLPASLAAEPDAARPGHSP